MLIDDAQGAGQFFRDQNLAPGKKCQSPGCMQRAGKGSDGIGGSRMEGSSRLLGEERLIIFFFRRA